MNIKGEFIMYILICDDEPAFGEKLQNAAAAFFAAKNIPVQFTLCTSAEQVLHSSEAAAARIAFLDVQLGNSNGIELGRRLKQQNPSLMLIYVSAYLEFAPEGYTVKAFRYLLKPDIERTLPPCLEDVCSELLQKQKVLSVTVNRHPHQIPYDSIFFLESDGRQIHVWGEDLETPLCTYYSKLSELPAELFESGFLRVGRSTVAHMRYIQKITGYKVILCNGAQLSASRASYSAMRKTYLEWSVWK